MIEALKVSRGNKAAAARILGVSRVTVWNRMKKYNLRVEITDSGASGSN